MKKYAILVMAVLTIFSVSAFAQDTTGNNVNKKAEKITYTCPNHPDEMSDKPGKCSKCGTELNLSPKEKAKWSSLKLYTCPMHPDVHSDKPGKCSKCGMDMQEAKTVYSCPNHPDEMSDKPGKCSKCGTELNLSPKEKAKWSSLKLYTCPMHPDVHSDKPGKCSKCGMDMTEKKKEKSAKHKH